MPEFAIKRGDSACATTFKKVIVRYKKIIYNIDVLRQTACLVVNPTAYLFNGTMVDQTSD